MNEPPSQHSEMERLGIAVFLAVLGFLTGIIAVWMLTNLPGIETSGRVYLAVAFSLGIACFILGYRSSDRTFDMLGDIWDTTWKLSTGLLRIIRLLAR